MCVLINRPQLAVNRKQRNLLDMGGDVHKITRGGFLKTLFAAFSLPLAGSASTFAHPGSGQSPWLSPGLGTLPVLTLAASRRVSPENPTGEKGMAARATPNPSDPKTFLSLRLLWSWARAGR
jgi:hypothetical protein